MVRKLLWLLVGFLCTTAWGAGGVEIAVELTVPDAAWKVTIDEVYRVGDELWVISTIFRDPDVMGVQVISTVRASLKLDAPELPVKHFVTGKSWDWQNHEPYVFIDDRLQIDDKLKEGSLLYRRKQQAHQ